MNRREFSILITEGKDGLFLASAIGFIGGGSTIKEALDAWVDAIVDDAIQRAMKHTREATR